MYQARQAVSLGYRCWCRPPRPMDIQPAPGPSGPAGRAGGGGAHAGGGHGGRRGHEDGQPPCGHCPCDGGERGLPATGPVRAHPLARHRPHHGAGATPMVLTLLLDLTEWVNMMTVTQENNAGSLGQPVFIRRTRATIIRGPPPGSVLRVHCHLAGARGRQNTCCTRTLRARGYRQT